jgi:hypothetical protein
MLHYNVGGSAVSEYAYQNVPSPTETATETDNDSYKGTRFAKILSSFNITVWF